MSKTKTKTYTLSELAKIAEVAPSSMSDFIRKHNLKPSKTGEYNRKYFDSKAYDIVMKHYKNSEKTKTRSSNTTKDDIIAELRERLADKDNTIALLKDQLNVKDKQIADDHKTIDTISKLADQAQQLDLTTHGQQKQLQEVDGSVVSKLNSPNSKTEPAEDTNKPPNKHHWWQLGR